MKCKQFRKDLPDWLTNRLDSPHQAEMSAHGAHCPACARWEREERTLGAAWQNLPQQPTPNLLPRLTARLETTQPAPRPRWGAFTLAGTACVLAVAAWLSVREVPQEAVSPPTAKVASRSQSTPPLEEMLEGVRWRSSEEWEARREPPAYNEVMRSLLVKERN